MTASHGPSRRAKCQKTSEPTEGPPCDWVKRPPQRKSRRTRPTRTTNTPHPIATIVESGIARFLPIAFAITVDGGLSCTEIGGSVEADGTGPIDDGAISKGPDETAGGGLGGGGAIEMM